MADETGRNRRLRLRRYTDGVKVAMITGDAQSVAQRVALGVKDRHRVAEVRPEDKAAREDLQAPVGRREGRDGGRWRNDAPALAQADVGLAIGAGTEVAIASAGVILAGDDPRVRRLGDQAFQGELPQDAAELVVGRGLQHRRGSLGAGVLALIGINMPMEVGALLMSLSTVVVA